MWDRRYFRKSKRVVVSLTESLLPPKLVIMFLNRDHFNGFVIWRMHHGIFKFPTTNCPEQRKSNEENDFDDAQYWDAQTFYKQTAAICQEIDDGEPFNCFVYFQLLISNIYCYNFLASVTYNTFQRHATTRATANHCLIWNLWRLRVAPKGKKSKEWEEKLWIKYMANWRLLFSIKKLSRKKEKFVWELFFSLFQYSIFDLGNTKINQDIYCIILLF